MSEKLIVSACQVEDRLEKIMEKLQGKNKMRASLFNMVVYAKKNQRDAYYREIIQKLIERFPSRILFVIENTESKNIMELSVSVLSAAEGESSIVCDLIEIEVASDRRKEVPFAILPHLLPDLPIYLLWGDDPSKEDPLSFNLERLAHRTIFDSEVTDELFSYAKAIYKHMENTRSQIADLNWGRIENWRNLISSLFHSESLLRQFENCDHIDIYYNDLPTPYISHTKTQSIFLIFWIAAQFQWKCKRYEYEKDATIAEFTTKNRSIIVRFIPKKIELLKSGRIVQMDVFLTQDEKVSIARNKELLHHIIIQTCHGNACEMTSQQIFEKEESGQSVINEICHDKTSQHYLNMLSLILDIPNRIM